MGTDFGNRRLREMSPMAARQKFVSTLTGDPKTRDAYRRWLERYNEQKHTMGADFRAINGTAPTRRTQ